MICFATPTDIVFLVPTATPLHSTQLTNLAILSLVPTAAMLQEVCLLSLLF